MSNTENKILSLTNLLQQLYQRVVTGRYQLGGIGLFSKENGNDR